MADKKTKFSSEKELEKYLDSLDSDEARLTALKELESERIREQSSVSTDVSETSETTTEEILSSGPSKSTIDDIKEIKDKIEDGKDPLDTDPKSNVDILSKTINRVLPLNPLTAKRMHRFQFDAWSDKDIFHHNSSNKWGYSSLGGGGGFHKYVYLRVNIAHYGPQPGWDEITDIQEVGGGSPDSPFVIGGVHGRMGWNLDLHGTAGSVFTRTVEVTWLSGFTKQFTFSILNGTAGMNTGQMSSTGGSGGWWQAAGCTINNNTYLNHYFQNSNAYSFNNSTDFGVFTKNEPLENPGHWTATEYIAESDIGGMNSTAGYWGHEVTRYLQYPETLAFDSTFAGSQVLKVVIRPVEESSAFGWIQDPNTGGADLKNFADIVGAGNFQQNLAASLGTTGWHHDRVGVALAAGDWIYSSAAAFRQEEENKFTRGIYWEEIYYAENLEACPVVAQNSYDVCINPSSPNYYGTTCEDCNGNTIPASECNGTVAATFNDAGCCVDCDSFTLSVTSYDASYGTQNGYIVWDLADPSGSNNPSGTPFGSGSMYTVTITASTGAALPTATPTGGNTFTTNVTTNTTGGTEHLVTVASNSQITSGMQVSGAGIPAGSYVGNITAGNLNQNVTQFQLIDITGAQVNATAAATVTGTFAGGFSGNYGYLQPNNAGGLGAGTFYTLTATDDAGCTETINFTIGEAAAPTGCTDSVALNYNSLAVVDDGSCILCEAATGLITDPSGSMAGDLFPSSTQSTQDATVNASNVPQSDGIISLTANMQNTAAGYLEVDGSQSYTFTLLGLTTAGDPTTSTGTVATQAGLAVTTFGSSPTHSFTGVAYGHYAVKVQLVDNDEVHGLEACYTYFFFTVKVPVCLDPAATNINTSSVPADFQIVDNSLCTYPALCCSLSAIQEDTTIRGIPCAPYLYSEVYCDPTSASVYGHWELNGVMIPGSSFVLGAVGGGNVTIWLMDAGQSNLVTVDGTYEVVLTSTYAGAPDCTITISHSYVGPICDCTDPAAINYNPLATIDDGSCIFPSWDCVNGTCTDPGTGLGTWNSSNGGLSACQTNCIPIIPGCTDPCATNYNGTANIDDGSCTYSACLDATASNQYWSCDCNTSKPSATISDPGCCTYPCQTPNTVTCPTIIPSTGSCTTPNADGDIVIAVVLNTGATTWTLEFYDFTGTTVLCTDPTTYTGSTNTGLYSTICGVGLVAGNYIARVTDNLGCVEDHLFTIGTSVLTQGCTDPAADNYDPLAQCDDGTCVYCGCMDPLANNYNPNAVCDDGSCDYTVPDNPCIPPNIDRRITEITACLSEKGTEWLNQYRIGLNDDCSLMNKWKLIFIQYLLKNKDLTCLYNCADEDSPDVSTLNSCASSVLTGGPVTGLNDQGHAGSTYSSATGTVITNPATYFVVTNQLFHGDVITMPSGLVWTMTAPGSCTWGCYDPETATGAQSGHWTQCVPANNITITNSVNYIDNFLNFANKYCRDCGISVGALGKSKGANPFDT